MKRHRIGIDVRSGWLAAAILCAASCVVLRPSVDVPRFADVRARWLPSEAYLLDRHGDLLDTLRMDFGVRRLEWTSLDSVSPALIEAVIESEDHRFRQHAGVDWIGALAALKDRLFHGRTRGASTITMQLAGMIDPQVAARGSRGSLRRKLAQVRSARGIEAAWSKREILEAYFNLLEFRGELQGIAAAASELAGKAPSGLDVAESLVLAALLPSPNSGLEHVSQRACARASGMALPLTCETTRAVGIEILGRAGQSQPRPSWAPHVARALLQHPGQRLRSSLDARLQRRAFEILRGHLNRLSTHNVRDGAAIVVDNGSGEVLAYVGSAGARSRSRHVDGVRARRQAGSTLKPVLYGMALEDRFLTAASLLDDSPLSVDTANGIYFPRDYDGDYKGLVSVRTALAGSLNVPAVRTLMLVGVEAFREKLQQFGYHSIDRAGGYYGYALALGSAEVSLWEQAEAYRALARAGQWSPITLTRSNRTEGREVLSPAASYVVADILGDPAARTVTFGLDSHLNTGYWSAAKTGTSKDMRDNWCIGFSTRYTVAVWVGNFEGDSMNDVSGVTGAAPAWQEIMAVVHANDVPAAPRPPEELTAIDIGFTPPVEPPRREWFLEGTHQVRVAAVTARDHIARIASPIDGTVVAIDPDIPAALQRLPLRAQGTPTARLVLDGTVIGPAGEPVLWPLRHGTHRLVLEAEGGAVLDQVQFSVR